MNGYEIYLMVQLAQCNGIIKEELEYDTAWEEGTELLVEFQASKFDDENKPQYECIVEFLEDKNPTPKTIEVCSSCGSNHVERLHWVNPNTKEVGGTTDEDDDTWCNSCEGHHGIVEKKL